MSASRLSSRWLFSVSPIYRLEFRPSTRPGHPQQSSPTKMLLACAALTFSPRAAQPSRSRHALRSTRPVMREACKDTVCYTLSNAKPESVEKLSPAQQHGQSAPWQCPRSARAPPGWLTRRSQARGRPAESPATASGARASRLQSAAFPGFDHPRHSSSSKSTCCSGRFRSTRRSWRASPRRTSRFPTPAARTTCAGHSPTPSLVRLQSCRRSS